MAERMVVFVVWYDDSIDWSGLVLLDNSEIFFVVQCREIPNVISLIIFVDFEFKNCACATSFSSFHNL